MMILLTLTKVVFCKRNSRNNSREKLAFQSSLVSRTNHSIEMASGMNFFADKNSPVSLDKASSQGHSLNETRLD